MLTSICYVPVTGLELLGLCLTVDPVTGLEDCGVPWLDRLCLPRTPVLDLRVPETPPLAYAWGIPVCCTARTGPYLN